MADSFFGFNTSLNEGLELVEEPELDEEEYDALNDETFGADAFQGDWEEDHTRFAEVAENSRTYRNSYNSEKDDDLDLEASISQLVLEGEEEGDDEDADSNDKLKTTKTNNNPDRLLFDYIGGSNSTWSFDKTSRLLNKLHSPQPLKSQPSHTPLAMPSTNFLPPQLSRIPTVQELERDLMQKNKQSKYMDKENKLIDISHTMAQGKKSFPGVMNSLTIQNSNNQFQSINAVQHNASSKLSHSMGSNKFPPGFGPPQQSHFNQPQQQEMVMLRNNQNMPPMQLGPLLLPPHLPMLLSPHILPPPSHPLLLGQNPRINSHPIMRFMPNHPLLMQQQQHQLQQQQLLQKQMHLKQMQNKIQSNQDHMRNGQASRNHHSAGHSQHPWLHNPNRRGNGNYDEYAGLMNNKERQWLLNIQIIQLATDKPHVDDYYYMVWSKKQEKEKKAKEETRNGLKPDLHSREPFFANNRQLKTDANQRERRDSEREVTATPSPRVYVPLQFENSLGKLQCGSVTAPRKIIDLDVVPERQVETAPPTSHRDSRKTKKLLLELEQLYLLAMDVEDLDNNMAPEENTSTEETPSKAKLLEQIMTSYLNEERFINFMCIRKGKTLLLRVLPHLSSSDHFDHLTNFWCRLIKSVSIIVRRDQNDGILLQIYPYFKKWINSVDCTILSVIASYLLTANIPNNSKKSSRAISPNSGRSVLLYILTTTFGVSVVSSILCRGETIYPNLEEKEKLDWTNFVLNFIKHIANSPNLESQIPTPLDPLPANVLTVILNRSTGLHIQDYASAKRALTAFNKDKSRS